MLSIIIKGPVRAVLNNSIIIITEVLLREFTIELRPNLSKLIRSRNSPAVPQITYPNLRAIW